MAKFVRRSKFKRWNLNFSSPMANLTQDELCQAGEPDLVRIILVYGRQAFASMAFCGMLAKEFPDHDVMDANSREGLSGLDPCSLDLVVVTTSAATNQGDMDALNSVLLTAESRPALAILGDIGLAAKPEQAVILNLRGVFPDETSPAVVLAGIRFILAGGQYFPREINSMDESLRSAAIAGRSVYPASEANVGANQAEVLFTARELAVLKALSTGKSNKTIARNLSISENTAKIHVRGILRKLECANRTEAALMAQRLNLVDVD
jgi:DNA-binding NarL/FixJ family response regulator